MAKSYRNQVSIIAGQWRGSKISVVDFEDLRPTSGRIKETLFNWLQFEIRGLTCLDLFAGSGALGFEAASRGAEKVIMVERQPKICRHLELTAQRLEAKQINVFCNSALDFLGSDQLVYDLVFLDPPFRSDLLDEVCQTLEESGILAENAKIYLETAKSNHPHLPTTWTILHSKSAGDVNYKLLQRCHM
ncbi:MAG: 16S rRNA (guanine(966)-N(2))-methyltransferase RsmD [Gammaproteobacteria bacterium]|nr:16S rRNA (guanine(966)-N(2))-methyltransferase RsmD [Gammaproteobacteria bacterium]